MLRPSGTIDAIKAAVRPMVTWGLVAVQAGLAVAWATGANAEQAFAALGPFTMMAMTFWFRSREGTPLA
ncbi:MAG: hypothetical protein HOH95_11180 [Dehalococcoidia bacterium]|nr:hypothetical protein [Dehalococcoidia bacterium]